MHLNINFTKNLGFYIPFERIYYNDHTIIDGHSRFEIAGMYSTAFDTKEFEFENIEDVKEMIMNQLGKRNLTEEQKKYLRGHQYKNEKSRHGGDRKSRCQNDILKERALK